MFVFVQGVVGGRLERVRLEIGRDAGVGELRRAVRDRLKEALDEETVAVDRLRLLFRGKELVVGHTLFDYDVRPNDTLLLHLRPNNEHNDKDKDANQDETANQDANHDNNACQNVKYDIIAKMQLWSLEKGALVDVLDKEPGAWFEARVLAFHNKYSPAWAIDVEFVEYAGEKLTVKSLSHIKPLSQRPVLLSHENLPGTVVMVNYNFDEPHELGFWYIGTIDSVDQQQRTANVSIVLNHVTNNITVPVNNDPDDIQNTRLFYSESFHADLSNYTQAITADEQCENTWDCDACKRDPSRVKCTECGCGKCRVREAQDDKSIVCDQCQEWFHFECVGLTSMPPEDDWYCPDCVNENTIINPGDKLNWKGSKKAAMPSAKTNRKWGSGMACVGVTKKCTIVGNNHVGAVPGVDVGTTWMYRIQVAEAGVHRPPVSGIHGSQSSGGAFSICMSKGYDEDEDFGDNVYYTGSGGRDLSGNKRAAKQTSAQTLDRANLALAMTCDAPVNSKEGAEAKDWQRSRPIRLVRTDKMHLRKGHGEFAPRVGCRYDGVYKLVKYWPERFHFRRDDPSPAPWTDEWKEWAKDKPGLGTVIMPEGKSMDDITKDKKKRVSVDDGLEQPSEATKKVKTELTKAFAVPEQFMSLIKQDTLNTPHWDSLFDILERQAASFNSGHYDFLLGPRVITIADFIQRVSEHFACPICQDLCGSGDCDVPVTLSCGGGHTFCLKCVVEMTASMTTDKQFAAKNNEDEGKEEQDNNEPELMPDSAEVSRVPTPNQPPKKKSDYEPATCCPVCRASCRELRQIQHLIVQTGKRRVPASLMKLFMDSGFLASNKPLVKILEVMRLRF